EVEAGLGQEALQEAWPVLHPPQPGLHQRGQLADVLLDQVGQRSFKPKLRGLRVGIACLTRHASQPLVS
ncbi:MAG TPA: hypothetical protein VGD83_32760, partial [Streptosporangiaceae bacterium]